MQAAVCYCNADNVKVTRLQRRSLPLVGDNDVLISIKACALDALDVKREKFRNMEKAEFVPGLAICGTLEKIGCSIQGLAEGDQVVSILPIDGSYGGCAQYTVANAALVTKVEDGTNSEEACSILLPALRAYSALLYQINLRRSEWLLLVSSTRGVDTVAVQLAVSLGAKVIVAASGAEVLNFFRDCGLVTRVVDAESESVVLAVQQETGGLGVDAILDYRHLFLPLARDSASRDLTLPGNGVNGHHKTIISSLGAHVSNHDLIHCMGPQARWAHCHHSFQLDPPASRQLALRGASISFLAPEIWLLAPSKLGSFLHILTNITKKYEASELRATIGTVLPLNKVKQALKEHERTLIGSVVVISSSEALSGARSKN